MKQAELEQARAKVVTLETECASDRIHANKLAVVAGMTEPFQVPLVKKRKVNTLALEEGDQGTEQEENPEFVAETKKARGDTLPPV